MTLWSDSPMRQDIDTRINGADMAVPFTLSINSVAYVWAGTTVTTSITTLGNAVAAVPTLTFTTGAAGVATISLTSAQKTTLGVGTYNFSITATIGAALQWSMAGMLFVKVATEPGTSTAGIGITVSSGAVTITATTSSLLASNVSVVDAGLYYAATDVEAALAEIATTHTISGTGIDLSTTGSMDYFVCLFPLQVLAASWVQWNNGVTASDTDFWTMDLRYFRGGDATGVTFATKTTKVTGGQAIVQRQGWNWDAVVFSPTLSVLQKDDVVGLVATKTGAPGNIGSTRMTFRYKPV